MKTRKSSEAATSQRPVSSFFRRMAGSAAHLRSCYFGFFIRAVVMTMPLVLLLGLADASHPSFIARRTKLLAVRGGSLSTASSQERVFEGDDVGASSWWSSGVEQQQQEGPPQKHDDAPLKSSTTTSHQAYYDMELQNREEYIQQSFASTSPHQAHSYDQAQRTVSDEPTITDTPHPVPRINVEDIALALRWTGEANRRLQAGTDATTAWHLSTHDNLILSRHQRATTSTVDLLRGGAAGVQAYRIPTSRNSSPHALAHDDSSSLSIFHAMNPHPKRRGVLRWGPELEGYVRKLVEVLKAEDGSEDENTQLELALAMLYLDRACSVDTPRKNTNAPACPFCVPRTVHRLLTTAYVIAKSALRGGGSGGGGREDYYSKLHDAFGIPVEHSQAMTAWMQAALGDSGFFVSPEEMSMWKNSWEARFSSL